MAPEKNQKRCKGVQVFRPFVFGSNAKLFDPTTNPKPANTPEDHTHSWEVFVKGVDDTDITYWCKKVQFKLHESIPNPVRTIENVAPGAPFRVFETGWGEFEIAIKLYYVQESGEKPQTFYHHLRLHPFGTTDEEKEAMRQSPCIKSWVYEEQLFNEPYDGFFDLLTSPLDRSKAGGGKGGKGKGTKVMRGGMVGSTGERTALLPLASRPGQPFSRETEKAEIKKLQEAKGKVDEMVKEVQRELRDAEEEIKRLREEAKAA
ncbi:chromatin-modifying complex subunit AF9 [Amylocarpus encephaloides]|uniref:Protein AF-9 homolog n=1 Tax=Amylocarpus encephaloides TaxID=45428 RepID=A0A9P7YCW6_9HELO|nr:chromatin-modifying complex subunit AF9 [Amylocarpus encephaloides]